MITWGNNTLISISIARFRRPNLPFNCPRVFCVGTREIIRKNFSPYCFSHPLKTPSKLTEEDGMLDLPTKKTGTGSLFGTIRFGNGDTVSSKTYCVYILPGHLTAT